MCGIIGAWFSTISLDNLSIFDIGLELLSHRGPDDKGLKDFRIKGGQLILGQTRLAIIDLSAGGHQPMLSPDGRWALVFNGEIYNYRELRSELQQLGIVFISESDTEVLMHSWIVWGASCISRLCGMFAFAVCDTHTGEINCVRDAFGIKPFYYSTISDKFIFASEIPAILSLFSGNPEFNAQRVSDYLVYGQYDDSNETFFEDINQLPAGHILTLRLQAGFSPVLTRWWWPTIAENKNISFEEAALILRAMFLQSVRLHLRSDVPLGAALSGGIDSSAVVCAVRHLEPDLPIHTFSYIANDSPLSEERWVDIVNRHVGAIAHKVAISGQSLIDDLNNLIDAQGEPFGGTSIYAQYCVFRQVRESGIVVSLDGQGADEMMAGYDGYPAQRIRSLLESYQFARAFSFVRKWALWPGRSMTGPIVSAVFSMLPAVLQRGVKRMLKGASTPIWLSAEWFSKQGVDCRRMNNGVASVSDGRGRRVVATLRANLAQAGLNTLLRHGDRSSMHFSVESRVPFLTVDMAEFLLSLPEHYLISDSGETKHVFRAAMRGIVPDLILDRKDKIGFATPEGDLLKQCSSQALEWLDAAESIPFLNTHACKSELAAMISGDKRYSGEMWRLINFCQWTVSMTQLRQVQAR